MTEKENRLSTEMLPLWKQPQASNQLYQLFAAWFSQLLCQEHKNLQS